MIRSPTKQSVRTVPDRFLLAALSALTVSACTPPGAELEPGRAVGEFAESQPVLILAALITEEGADLAIPITPAGPPATPAARSAQ